MMQAADLTEKYSARQILAAQNAFTNAAKQGKHDGWHTLALEEKADAIAYVSEREHFHWHAVTRQKRKRRDDDIARRAAVGEDVRAIAHVHRMTRKAVMKIIARTLPTEGASFPYTPSIPDDE